MKNWNLKILLIPPLIILALFFSWLTPLFRPYWNALDSWTFYTLNTWVHESTFWQNFWAFTGTRLMDWIHDIFMFLFFFYTIKKATLALKARKIAELIGVIFFMALTICLVNGIMFPEFIHAPRKSPTMIDREAFRLSSVIEWTKVKDHSRKSFPGDHATTAVLFTCFVYYLMGWRLGLLATLYAIFFCLPRLIVGAHWLTDILLGSSLIAISVSSLIMGTPIGNGVFRFFEKVILKLRAKFRASSGY